MKKGPRTVDQHVGMRVRMRRLMLRKSQNDLAKALGVTFQQVQKNEKGLNRIGASRLEEIARYLEVPVSYFFEGLPNQQQQTGNAVPNYTDTFIASVQGVRIAKAFEIIDDDSVRKCLVELIEHMARMNGKIKRTR